MKTAMLVLLALLLAVGPAVTQSVDDRLIVPGVRIGKWTLQMTIGDLVRMNGPAQTLDEDDPDFVRRIYESHWQMPGLSLTAVSFDHHRIEVLLFHAVPMGATVYKTDKGIGFLNTRQEVLRLYGQPTIAKAARMLGRTNIIYDKIGIGFQVDNTNTTDNNASVALIAVFRAASANSIWKF